MLPSLTTLASGTHSIIQGSPLASTTLVTSTATPSSASASASASASSSPVSSSTIPQSAAAAAVAKTIYASTSAQVVIRRILSKRKPQTVVGLQYEGSSPTELSLAAYKMEVTDGDRCGQGPTSKRECKSSIYQGGVALARSNPHYREREHRPIQPSQQQQHSPLQAEHNYAHHSEQQHLSQPTTTHGTSTRSRTSPNIMMQDPLQHDRVQFAISASLATVPDATGDALTHESPPSAQTNDDLASDIVCHFSSVLHPFIVTGHMDGSVRLWDLSVKEVGCQCIRSWHTGSRQRVLCVGMNAKVVICGNVDSTLCVWDIHPTLGMSSSTHGTIHTASYLATTMAAGVEDWGSGIEHICVGDSLVACSTEFSGSVLVFSIATGSLVYEIPGLYQPSKLCMTDFFLLTGGRGPWNQGRRAQGHGEEQEHGQGQGVQDADRSRHGQYSQNVDVDEHMTCCINVWDLRTGQRLYSLIPRLPVHHLQNPANVSSMIHQHPYISDSRSGKNIERQHVVRTSNISPDMSDVRNVMQRTQSSSSLSSQTRRMSVQNESDESSASSIASTGYEFYVRPQSLRDSPFLVSDSGSAQISYNRSSSNMRSPTRLSTLPSVTWASTGHVSDNDEDPHGFHCTHWASSTSPQSAMSAPLTLLDIAVTPDHATLVVTLCERSGDGREGVYAWDFAGTRLEGYHEIGQGPAATILADPSDYFNEADNSDMSENEASVLDGNVDGQSFDKSFQILGSDTISRGEGGGYKEHGGAHIESRINNNMVMQQVDSTALSTLHHARVTGKVWIGWKLDDGDFQRFRRRYLNQLENH
ncbi:hypothetical protein BG004_000895 [Podila humilis]|nr:hypothetical protein BG004_000895 [Podila humilis]